VSAQRHRRTLILGGGPAGLYLSILLKKADALQDVELVERNPADATFGFGVVFSDETLGYLRDNDEPTFSEIAATFERWDAIEVRHRGKRVVSPGHGFSGIRRGQLLEILQRRASSLGVCMRFQAECEPGELDRLMREYDLVVAADGANSRIRSAFAEAFQPSVEPRHNKYAWFGTTLPFEHFLFSFRETAFGLFWCHAYRYDASHSTFIVECDPSTWRAAGLDHLSESESAALCEQIFADDLLGNRLLTNRSTWINFPMLHTAQWRMDNVILLGDAAHTAHFSIGSGTKLAMEDAIGLAFHLARTDDVGQALDEHEEERRPQVRRFQNAAYESLSWFEGVERYMDLDTERFAFSLLTRSRRLSYDTLMLRDPLLVRAVHSRFVEDAGVQVAPGCAAPPPMFTPFNLRGLTLANRVVVSPMCMYSACDGAPNDWHLVHLGTRAIGGAGLVFTEMTDVSAAGRISPGCAGIYTDEHQAEWARVVEFVHNWSDAGVCMQLGHAGPKGSTRLSWEGDCLPLESDNWPLLAGSAIPYFPGVSQVPAEMTRADMDRVIAEFEEATCRANTAGFDMLEVHMAHGYLLASFLSPLTNVRTDGYGGPIQQRLRFPLEVFEAVRARWPAAKPMSVRISATDWATGGITSEDTLVLARTLKACGLDILDISAGQTVAHQVPRYGRMYQTPFSDRIRNEACIPTMTVGAITNPDEVNSILLAGRADLCVLARPHLRDPYWTLHAAQAQDYFDLRWPRQYEAVQPKPREVRVAPRPLVVRFDEDQRGEFDELQAQLTAVARRHYRSLNGEMLTALRGWVDRFAFEQEHTQA
jgi:anthraniloyl-CoA monooxygenase